MIRRVEAERQEQLQAALQAQEQAVPLQLEKLQLKAQAVPKAHDDALHPPRQLALHNATTSLAAE
jgi:hypothetical protein